MKKDHNMFVEIATSNLSSLSRQILVNEDAPLSAVSITQLGDALRCSVPVGDTVVQWIQRHSAATLRALVAEFTDDLVRTSRQLEDTKDVGPAVLEYDVSVSRAAGLRHVESLMTLTSPGLWTTDYTSRSFDLEVARARLEDQLNARVSGREECASYLGLRADMAAEWTHRLDREQASLLDDAQRDAYLVHGTRAAMVEAEAARDPAFAGALVQRILQDIEAQKPVCLHARRVLKEHGNDALIPPIIVPFDQRVAAAAGDLTVDERPEDLGPLPEVDAHAHLVRHGHQIELRIFTEKELASVAFGDKLVELPIANDDGVHTWSVLIDLADTQGPQAIRMTVVAAGGARYEEVLPIELAK